MSPSSAPPPQGFCPGYGPGHSNFLVRSRILTSKLLGQEYRPNRIKLITTFKKFHGRHYDLIGKFQHSVTHMVTDLFLETLFLRWHDGVAGPFTARTLITYIDILYLCLLRPVYLLLNLTFTDFDIFISCGRCH